MIDSGADLTARLAAAILQSRNGRCLLGGIELEHLAGDCGTPLYIYDSSIFERQYTNLRRALPKAIEIFYSIKANPHPAIVEFFLQLGAGCEIASGGEYAIARRAGASPGQIVFAGPGKGQEELEFVIAHGIGEIHVEGFDEIGVLDDISSRLNTAVSVSIRVNPGAALGGGLLMGGQPTAFGFEEESLSEAVQALRRSPRLKLRGVHLYTGTQILDSASLLRQWAHAVEIAKRVASLTGEPVSTIDLGGGLGIPYFAHEKELDLEAVGRGARELIESAESDKPLSGCRFIVEPGRFLAGPAGVYVARVRSVKACRGTTFVVLDGGMNHHLAASGNLGQVVRRDYPIVNLSRAAEAPDETVVVAGPLCTPIDTLGRKVKLARPRVGDLIGILQSGAYGLTASPINFLTHPTPAEVLVRDGQYEVITPRTSRFDVVKEQGCGA